MLLSDFLRHELGLTGTHVGCEQGVCGACTVLFDGEPVRSCLMFAVQATGHEVTTVEALGVPGNLHLLQEAFMEAHGLQCGFCTPGILMTILPFLEKNPDPTEDEVRHALDGNLCAVYGLQAHCGCGAAGGAKDGGTVVETKPEACYGVIHGVIRMEDKEFKFIGKRFTRTEDPRLLTGQALFTDDVQIPGMLHAAFLRSDYAHGRINSIDVSEARKRPGVVAAYTR